MAKYINHVQETELQPHPNQHRILQFWIKNIPVV